MNYFTKKLRIIIVLIFISAISISRSLSQDSTSTTDNGFNHWGVGLKFNHPSGITIKKNFNNMGIEFIIGRYNPWNYNVYYYFRNNKDLKGKGYVYDGFEPIHDPFSLQVHLLTHKNIRRFPGLRWYYGYGVQVRTFAYEYSYYHDDGITKTYGKERVNGIGAGVDVLIGLEYNFKSIPFTIFSEFSTYVEAIHRPLYMKANTSWGIRYNFR